MKDKTMAFILLLLVVVLVAFGSGVVVGTIAGVESTKLCEEKGMEIKRWDSLTVTCLEFDDNNELVEERVFRR